MDPSTRTARQREQRGRTARRLRELRSRMRREDATACAHIDRLLDIADVLRAQLRSWQRVCWTALVLAVVGAGGWAWCAFR